jgi:hypothetical protein
MATHMTATAASVNGQRREMQEVRAPEMFQFTKDHSRLDGVFLGLCVLQRYTDKEVMMT